MNRRGSTIAGAVLSAMLITVGSPGWAHAESRAGACARKGSTTLLKTGAARVYSAQDDGGIYACLVSVGRARLLDTPDNVYSFVSDLRLAGRFVAWSFTELPACKADCPPEVTAEGTVEVLDLRRGRRRLEAAFPSAVALTRHGAIAWTTGSGRAVELFASDARGRRMLDSGAIAPGSLEVWNSKVLWTHGGDGRWAALSRAVAG